APHKGATVAESLAALDALFRTDVSPDEVAAIVIEPVQGEGGFLPAPKELLLALRAACDEHGIVLVADEVQTGFARTGRMFGIEHSGVRPDLVTVAGTAGFFWSGRAPVFFVANVGTAITWSFVVPYIFGMLSRLDPSGRLATLGGFMSKLGLASGP